MLKGFTRSAPLHLSTTYLCSHLVSLVRAMCYKWYKMDTTVRNLDPQAYRALRARAVLEGRTVGELISEAIRGVSRPGNREAGQRDTAGASARTLSGGE